MNREEAHKLVDEIFDANQKVEASGVLAPPAAPPAPEEKPVKEPINVPVKTDDSQRVVRTKTSGDRVFLLDEEKKTRQWITNEKVLEGLGFSFSDVEEIDDTEFFKYQMAQAIYKVEEPKNATA